MGALELRDTVIAYLADLGVDLTDGEPATGPDGRVRRTVIVDTTTGRSGGRRMSGRATIRDRQVNLLVVTASRDSCVWLTDRVTDRLDGARLDRGGILRDDSYDLPPAQEPGTAPARWSRPITLYATTQRGAT